MGMLFGATVLIATQFYLIAFNIMLQGWWQEQLKAPLLQGYTRNLLGSLLVAEGHLLSQFYKIVKNLAHFYLSGLLSKLSSERIYYRLRSRETFTQFSCRTSRFRKYFFPSAITGWNSLDLDVWNSVSLPTFKAKLKSTLFPHCYSLFSSFVFDFSFSRHASLSSETWFFLSKRIFVQN